MDLTTLASVKEWLGETGTADDVLLARLISAVSVAAERRMGRQIALSSFTETRNGSGRTALAFRNTPVASVAQVKVDGTAIAAQASPSAAGYAFDAQLLYLTGYTFTKGRQNVTLQYTAGFVVTPKDLEEAVLEIVAHKYRGRAWIGQSSKNIGGEVITFLNDVPVDALRVIDGYRRVIAE